MQSSNADARLDVPQTAAVVLARLRARAPRIHCITNAVAQNFTANLLLAAGCVPSMSLSSQEIAPFVARADGLLVNLGTFDNERREATEIAVETALQEDLPWVLDPVFIERSTARAAFARALAVLTPRAMRLNHAEFTALAGGPPADGTVGDAARTFSTVIGLSGETDLVADGERTAWIGNGHPLMAKVTAMGCAASALTAACLAVEPDAFRAVGAAFVIVGVAGEIAAETARGPGSFAVAVLDALHMLDDHTLTARAKVT